MITRADDTAMPFLLPRGEDDYSTGLSKREYIATRFMQSLLSDIEVSRWLQEDPRYTGFNFKEVVAINAIEFTDALIEQLNKTEKK